MYKYIIRKVLAMIPTLFGITLITFLLFNVVGRDPALLYAGKNSTPEQINTIRKELGLDQNLAQQYLFYLKQVVQMDFGRSWSTKQKIWTMLEDGIGASLSLAVPPFIFTLALSLLIAIVAVFFKYSVIDRGILILCLVGMSLSVLIYIVYFQYFFAYKLSWFPISGYDSSWSGRWKYLYLGWMIWVLISLGSQVLFFRSLLIQESSSDYVRTARSKGVSRFSALAVHALRNALIPMITLIVIELPFLYTGSLFIEAFFGIPGLGGMLVQALGNSDFPVIKATTFIGAFLYVLFNLISDLCYAWVDPRVQLR